MASYVSPPEDILIQSKDLGKYGDTEESRNENARSHDKSRVLAAEEVDIIRMCGGCGKHMPKVKSGLVCSCKLAIHCSKDCLKSSKHKCQNINLVSKENNDSQENAELQEKINKFTKAVVACRERYFADRFTNRGPSSEKVAWLKKIARGDHRRILKYGEAGNSTAAYVIGRAYMEREFDRQKVFAIPPTFREKSAVEIDEIAVKWLKVAAEAGVPEAMFLLFIILRIDGGLRVDRRVSEYWLAQAHATGEMEYLIQILETPRTNDWPEELDFFHKAIIGNSEILVGQELNLLVMATRFRELKAWNGKTAMGETFYGWGRFISIAESIGKLKNDQSRPSFIEGEKKTLLIIPARLGYSHFAAFTREENNLKFKQGSKVEVSPDYQLANQTSSVEGRTSHLISCKHDQVNMEEQADQVKCDKKINGMRLEVNKSLVEISKSYKLAGKCEPCVQEATQRLRAVSLGLFSMSITPVYDDGNHYAARYANEDGGIVQDVFTGYSKPYMRQLLQCLMSNPPDLHPLAVAEDAMLFWPIIWFWGSVYEAVRDTCNEATLDAVYGCLGDNNNFAKSQNDPALAAFPDAAAGEWRIACGNDDCPRVDHEVKFNLCKGCKVRRYCDAVCQRKDWTKHMKFCKAGKKEEK